MVRNSNTHCYFPFHLSLSVVSLVINGNLQQTNQLCARKGRNVTDEKIKDFFVACTGMEYNEDLIQAKISVLESHSNMNTSLGIYQKTSNVTMSYLIGSQSAHNLTLDPSKTSVREVLILGSTEYGYLLIKPISSFANVNKNHTLLDILTKARKQAGISDHQSMDSRLLSAWANTNQTHVFTVPVSQLLTITPNETMLSIGDVINFFRFQYKRPFFSICGGSSMLMNQSLEMLSSCVSDQSMFGPLGYSRVKSFNGKEAALLTEGNVTETMNILNVLDLINKGFDKVVKHTAEPLVLLARGKNITLADLKSKSLVSTLMKIFGVDQNVIRKVFSDITDELYHLLSQTPLMGLVNTDSGLKSVQELYTGSVQTMLATVLANETSTEAIEKHLPRYVTMISSMDFPMLFNVYETTSEAIKDMTLVDVVHLFFGNFSTNNFKMIYSLDASSFTKVKKMRFQTAQSLVHNVTMKSTLFDLIKAAALVDNRRILFLESPLKDLFSGKFD